MRQLLAGIPNCSEADYFQVSRILCASPTLASMTLRVANVHLEFIPTADRQVRQLLCKVLAYCPDPIPLFEPAGTLTEDMKPLYQDLVLTMVWARRAFRIGPWLEWLLSGQLAAGDADRIVRRAEDVSRKHGPRVDLGLAFFGLGRECSGAFYQALLSAADLPHADPAASLLKHLCL